MNTVLIPRIQPEDDVPRSDAVPAFDTGAVALPLPVRLYRIALRRIWVIIGTIAAALALGLIATLLATPLYTASAQIEIAREGNRVLDIQSVEREASQFDLEFYQTQYGLLKSKSLAEKVVRSLRLHDDPAFQRAFGLVEDPEERTGPAVTPAEAQRRRIAGSMAAVLSALNVSPVRSSRLVNISFTSPDPALSARLANAWGANFIQMNLERRFEATSYARKFLEDRLEQLRQRLETSERALVTYSAQQGIINLPGTVDRETGATVGERSLLADELASLNQELAQAQADRIQAESNLKRTRSAGSNPEALSNQAIGTLRGRRAELSADYSKMMVQFAPDYPPARALQSQIAELDRAIAREEGRVGGSFQSVYSAATEREAALQRRVATLKTDVTDLRRRSIQYNIYQREVDTNRQLYDGLLQRYKEIGIAGGIGTNNISVVDGAETPRAPSSPRLMLNLLLALLLGAVAGAALAWLFEQLDEGIADPDELPRLLQVPLLGVVPQSKNEEPLAALANPKSGMVEAYLAIQTNLELSTSHGAPRTLTVTSTRPKEGKSTTSYAIAHSLARAGRKVVLVDGDMRSPAVHREFGLQNDIGLSNYLAGNNDLSASLHPSRQPGLSIMTAGPQPPNAADLLTGDRLNKLLETLLEHASHVIIDSPPVMGLADAPLIASAVEGTIFVVEARAVRTSLASMALNRLRRANINLLGAVLTKFDAKHTQYSYGYEYGYGYGRETTNR